MTTKLCATTKRMAAESSSAQPPLYPTGCSNAITEKTTYSQQCGRRWAVHYMGHASYGVQYTYFTRTEPRRSSFRWLERELGFRTLDRWISLEALPRWIRPTTMDQTGGVEKETRCAQSHVIHQFDGEGPIVMLQGCSAVPTEGQQKEAKKAGRDLL